MDLKIVILVKISPKHQLEKLCRTPAERLRSLCTKIGTSTLHTIFSIQYYPIEFDYTQGMELPPSPHLYLTEGVAAPTPFTFMVTWVHYIDKSLKRKCNTLLFLWYARVY